MDVDVSNFDDVIAKLDNEQGLLKRMQADGVQIGSRGEAVAKYICFVTTDPEVAKKYGMHDEREFRNE